MSTSTILLVDIGAPPLTMARPATLGHWAPSAYDAPPVTTPYGLSAAPTVGGIVLRWTAIEHADALYEVQRADDIGGAPGAAIGVSVTRDREYRSAESALTHWRVRAAVHGRVSPWSAWVSQAPGTADDLLDGASYARLARVDTVSVDDVARIGLRVAGSGQRIGDQRNLPQSMTTAFGAVRDNYALTARTNGSIDINAFTYFMGAAHITYDAVANAIAGLVRGNRYVVYCYDPEYAGGAQTWYANTSPAEVMQLGDGVVYAGEATIPTGGTSSGGAGGWCVDAGMYLPDGRLAGDVQAGERIAVWDDDPLDPRVAYLTCQRNQIVEAQPCHRIVTASQAEVIASDSTPMALRDGRIVRLPAMLGEAALVLRDGRLRWEPVIACDPAGVRRVAKITVHQRCYFAGRSADATIATHNPLLKP